MKHIFILLIGLGILSGCSSYVVEVDLTPKERALHQKTIADYTEKLKNWPLDRKQEDTKESGGDVITEDASVILQDETGAHEVKGSVELVPLSQPDFRPPFNYFLTMALAQERLGYLGDSLKTYKKAMSLYKNSYVAWSNMGRLYEQIGKYNTAIRYYYKVLDEFNFSEYLIDIAMAYVRKGDADEASKVYNEFRLKTNRTDLGLESFIQNLRSKNQ